MKKLLLSFILFIFCSIAFAQAPQKLSYQAMIRNNNNSLIINQTIGMRISIIQGTINGSIVYIERQTPTTNNIGLISIEIGSNPSGLNFNTINWAQGPFFIKTEIDPTGGNNYTVNGASELLSVPYALYADKANTITGVLPITNGGTGANNLTDIKKNIGINLKADLNSPKFSGIPWAPTATAGTNNQQIATTAFVTRAITKATTLPASTTTSGSIKLAGDLGGTADLPIILDDKITTNKIANNNVTNEKILSLDANKLTGTLSIAKGGTGDTSIAGLKTTLKIDKVDNTSDIDKPLSALNLAELDLKLNKADTLLLNNRINSKLSKSDTVSLSNRINTKLAITDTAGLSNRINTKLAITDTAGLSNRINTKAPINNPTFTGTVNGVTKTMVGLGNVDNTSDLNKPISTAEQTALNLKLNKADTVTLSNRINTKLAKTDTAGLSNRINTKLAKTDTAGLSNRINTKAPINNPTFTGTVNGITKTMVGLGNVDNTSDLNKPISTAEQTALNLKLNKADTVTLSNRINTKLTKTDTAGLSNRINSKAPINNPTFTGTVNGISKTMVGLGNVDNTTDVAKPVSTATQTALDLKANSAATQSALNLKLNSTDTAGLRNAINTKLAKTDTAGLSNRINTKAPINNPTFTGTVNGISKSMVGLSNVDNTTDAAKPVSTATQTALDLKANSAATQSALDLKAPLASPTFTGTVAGIDKTMVGLSNVDNTTDAAKPVSTATQTALDLKANSAATQSALDLKAPLASPTFTGTVNGITSAMVGLGNVDNTTDAAKPISTATQTALDLKANSAATQSALDLKAPLASPTFTGTVAGIDKAMVGLGNVDNTTDAAKPISTATQSALDNKLTKNLSTIAIGLGAGTSSQGGYSVAIGSEAGNYLQKSNSVAIGSEAGKSIQGTNSIAVGNTAGFSSQGNNSTAIGANAAYSNQGTHAIAIGNNAAPSNQGTYSIAIGSNSNTTQSYATTIGGKATANYTNSSAIGYGAFTSADNTIQLGANGTNGTTAITNVKTSGTLTAGTVTYPNAHNSSAGQVLTTDANGVASWSTPTTPTATSVGLGNVNNTSDADKPVSSATQTALDLKANSAATQSALNLKAPLANPTFTGTVNGISKAMVGLSNVDNTSDLLKPVSTANQTALDLKLNATDTAGLRNGINSKLAKTDTVGLRNGINARATIASPTFTGTVSGITKSMVGLSNVDNTTDAAKPVSTATQTALNLKLNATDTAGLRNGINARATIASPTFTGTPAAPTASTGTNTSQIATTAFVQDAFTSFATSNGSSSSTLTGAIWTSSTTGTLNGVGFTMSQVRGQTPSNWDMSTSDFTAAPLSATQNSGGISHGDDWVVTFASPVTNLKLYCKYWRTASYVFDQPLTLLSSGNGLTSPNSTTVSVNGWGNGIVQFAGPITTLTVNSSADLINDASGQILTFGVGSGAPTSGTGEIIRSANPTFTGTVSGITKAMVGLGDADNTSDLSKPISNATQAALDDKLNSTDTAGLRNGINARATIVSPTFTGTPLAPTATSGTSNTQIATTAFVQDAITGSSANINATLLGLGNVNNTSDLDKPISTLTQTALDLKAQLASPTFTGTVSGITKGMVGLEYVDNTSDAAKPVSTATQTALNLKLNATDTAGLRNGINSKLAKTDTTSLRNGINARATIESPTFTGTPTLPTGTIGVTQTAGNNTTALATTAFVQTAISSIATSSSVNEVSDEATATGGETSFTLSNTPGTNSKVKMFINGIRISKTAYTISGTTLTYIPANNGAYELVAGDRIQFDFSY